MFATINNADNINYYILYIPFCLISPFYITFRLKRMLWREVNLYFLLWTKHVVTSKRNHLSSMENDRTLLDYNRSCFDFSIIGRAYVPTKNNICLVTWNLEDWTYSKLEFYICNERDAHGFMEIKLTFH